MHDIRGLAHEEIAGILGCSVGNSKSQLFKARARLREMLAPYYGGEKLELQRLEEATARPLG
jgi:DNA-directed RNA polymerase specialized sigma24 family protein